jgi:hypothetical protein
LAFQSSPCSLTASLMHILQYNNQNKKIIHFLQLFHSEGRTHPPAGAVRVRSEGSVRRCQARRRPVGASGPPLFRAVKPCSRKTGPGRVVHLDKQLRIEGPARRGLEGDRPHCSGIASTRLSLTFNYTTEARPDSNNLRDRDRRPLPPEATRPDGCTAGL